MLNDMMVIVKIPGYMTTAQAAEYLEITPGRVRQLVTMGVFSPEKAGNTNLIPIEQVESYEQNRNKAGWQKGRPRKP